ncbi:hypothetical protein [Priestia megaterium]|uniref:hypothetical protein n=1 Tax=Priestia megaterium TaxID=1404 RepID=UPI002E24DEB9|nr:hypothetical protein [Priestia megaterium]MED4278295.1 hypothetical protein [Priestia megaterium]MED4314400.1 hypothetical protein [Priestia megaterium]
MQQYQMKDVVNALIYNLKEASEVNHHIFFKYVEQVCTKNNDYYILGDLQLVADTLKKHDWKELVDVIALFDYKAALQLDVLLLGD